MLLDPAQLRRRASQSRALAIRVETALRDRQVAGFGTAARAELIARSQPVPQPAVGDGGGRLRRLDGPQPGHGGSPQALRIIDILAEITTSATGGLNARKYRVLILSPRSGSA